MHLSGLLLVWRWVFKFFNTRWFWVFGKKQIHNQRIIDFGYLKKSKKIIGYLIFNNHDDQLWYPAYLYIYIYIQFFNFYNNNNNYYYYYYNYYYYYFGLKISKWQTCTPPSEGLFNNTQKWNRGAPKVSHPHKQTFILIYKKYKY